MQLPTDEDLFKQLDDKTFIAFVLASTTYIVFMDRMTRTHRKRQTSGCGAI